MTAPDRPTVNAAIPEANIDAPSALGIMVGLPPAPENQVRFANAMSPRFLRWTMLNSSQVYTTVRVSRGEDDTYRLEHGNALDFDALPVSQKGANVTAAEFLRTGWKPGAPRSGDPSEVRRVRSLA